MNISSTTNHLDVLSIIVTQVKYQHHNTAYVYALKPLSSKFLFVGSPESNKIHQKVRTEIFHT